MSAAVCPVCGAAQSLSLLCSACCDRLEKALGDVASIVADLEITLSKQARIGNGGKQGKGSTHEKWPIDMGALEAGDNLLKVLDKWARSILVHTANDPMALHGTIYTTTARKAAAFLLSNVDPIRRHPDVVKLNDAVHAAIDQARRVVDRPADRIYLGQCMVPTQDEEGRDVTCWADIYASPGAREVQCKVCGVTHPVGERRAWLLQRAEDMLFTAAKASEILGEIGHITVTQARIRGYIHRGKIAYRAPVDAKRFRLGDLLALLVDESERRSA